MGLEAPALNLLENRFPVFPKDYVLQEVEGLKSVEDIERGLMHIISHVIATDADILGILRRL